MADSSLFHALQGASTAVVGDKMYLFGGRLVTERRMVSDMYVFDLKTFWWSKVENINDPNLPGPRYFHSMDLWNNFLVVFGGMGYKEGAVTVDDYCVLDDVRFYDIAAQNWLPQTPPADASIPFMPKARYAHLSSVSGSRLFVIGGQDLSNVWLDDVHLFDLHTQQWVHRRGYPRHCGTYRSVAVASPWRVRDPQKEDVHLPGAAGTRFRSADSQLPPSDAQFTEPTSFVHLPYSAFPTQEFPNEIMLYSNYNFTDVKRELEVFTPIPDEDEFDINDRSSSMGGNALPPGLRFPTGAVLGNHLILAGTYLASSYQSFSIWALDLGSMNWSRIDPGATLASGSWCRALLWEASNKFVIFGNRNGSLVDDYNRRLLTWDHVAYIDLEAFGIYQPPKLSLDIAAQELGLAAFEERIFADFDITCDDERRIPCSRRILEERWPWFNEQRALYQTAASEALKAISPPGAVVPLSHLPSSTAGPPNSTPDTRPDPRLTPRMLRMSEPYPVILAFVQYLYAQALITPLQHTPAVLSALLVLSSTYDLQHLQSLVVHAMHRALSAATSVGVYEVATLCNCQSLQIRSLKVVMSSSRRPGARSRQDRNDPAGRGSSRLQDSNGHARPRGMSESVRPLGSSVGQGQSRFVNGGQHESNGGRAVAPQSYTDRRTAVHSQSTLAKTRLSVPTTPTAHESESSEVTNRKRRALLSRPVLRKSSLPSAPEHALPVVPERSKVMQKLAALTEAPLSKTRPTGITLDTRRSQQREPIHVDHPYRMSDPFTSGPSVVSSPASSSQTEFDDLFFNAVPEAPLKSPPLFHLPFRAGPIVTPTALAIMTSDSAPSQSGESSRPETGSTDSSFSPGATSNGSSLESIQDEVLTPADSPRARSASLNHADLGKDDVRAGSCTPTLLRDGLYQVGVNVSIQTEGDGQSRIEVVGTKQASAMPLPLFKAPGLEGKSKQTEKTGTRKPSTDSWAIALGPGIASSFISH